MRKDGYATTMDTTSAGAGPADHRPDVAEAHDGGRGPDRALYAARAALEATAHRRRYEHLIAKADAAAARGADLMVAVYLSSAADALQAELRAAMHANPID